jgi:hypothetical protein
MIRRGLFAFLAAIVCASPVFAGPKYNCDFLDEDVVAAMQAAGAELATTCICAQATRPSEYKRCVTGVLNTRVRANLLTKGCARYVKTAYVPSVCGYPAGTSPAPVARPTSTASRSAASYRAKRHACRRPAVDAPARASTTATTRSATSTRTSTARRRRPDAHPFARLTKRASRVSTTTSSSDSR